MSMKKKKQLGIPPRTPLSVRNFPQVAYIRQSQSSTPKLYSSITSRISSRDENSVITPKMAKKVLAKYIIPMFHQQKKENHKILRKGSFQNSNFNSIPQKKLLSGKLIEKLELTKSTISKKETLLQASIKQTQQLKQELEQLKSKLKFSKENFQFVSFQNKQIQLRNSEKISSQTQNSKSLKDQQQKFQLSKQELSQNSSQFSKEKELNQKQLNIIIERQNSFSLVKMMNTLMGQTLKGLFSIQTDKQSTKIQTNLNKILKSAHQNQDFQTQTSYRLVQINNRSQFLIKKDTQTINIKQILINEILSIKNTQNSKVWNKKSQIKSASDTLKIYKQKLQSTQQKVDQISFHYNSLVQNFNKINRSKKVQDQQICQTCGQLFKESENFNWSCHHHASLWNGQIYFCCGSKKINSQGCIKSKHTQNQIKIFTKTKIICSCCRAEGHSHKFCPKDPNGHSQIYRKRTVKNTNFYQNEKLVEMLRSRKSVRKNTGGLDQSLVQRRLSSRTPSGTFTDISSSDIQAPVKLPRNNSQDSRVTLDSVHL